MTSGDERSEAPEPGAAHEASEPTPSWRDRLVRWTRELVFTVAVLAVGLVVFGRLRAPDLPDEAPDFTLPRLDGGELTLSSLRGQPVLVNFWATWCGPCRVELPTLEAFATAHPDLTVVGVAVDDPAAVRRFYASEPPPYPVVFADQATAKAWEIHTFPTSVVLDARGQVVWAHTGIVVRPQLEALRWLADDSD